MDAARLSSLRKHPLDAAGKEREQAGKTAAQFEQIFVRSMVSSLRQTGKLDEGGMFGSGPGSDTFGDWFDQNLAEQIGRESEIGVAEALLVDIKRHEDHKDRVRQQQQQQNPPTPGVRTADSLESKAATARAAADRSYQNQTVTPTAGGFDVVL